jgi:hypothetical protein
MVSSSWESRPESLSSKKRGEEPFGFPSSVDSFPQGRMKMSERLLEEPIELTDAELEVVSGGEQSANGTLHEDANENFHAQLHEVERGD